MPENNEARLLDLLARALALIAENRRLATDRDHAQIERSLIERAAHDDTQRQRAAAMQEDWNAAMVRLTRERDEARDLARRAAQALVDCLGASGPSDLDALAARACAAIEAQKAALVALASKSPEHALVEGARLGLQAARYAGAELMQTAGGIPVTAVPTDRIERLDPAELVAAYRRRTDPRLGDDA